MLNINEKMNDEEMIITLTGGLSSSYNVLESLKEEPEFYMYLRELDALDIIGDRIYKLYHYCCNDNKVLFRISMRLFRLGVFNQEEILNNLNKDTPVAFFDPYVEYDTTQDKYINRGKEKWLDYSSRLRESYSNRSNQTLLNLKPQTEE